MLRGVNKKINWILLTHTHTQRKKIDILFFFNISSFWKDCSVGFYSKKELKLHEKLMHEASQTGILSQFQGSAATL